MLLVSKKFFIGKFSFDLKKVVKTYSYTQHKRNDKLIEERNSTCNLTNFDLQRGLNNLYHMEFYQCLYLETKRGTTIIASYISPTCLIFHQKLLLFHSADIEYLSQLIQDPHGFKEVYKERPGDLVFSQNTKICMNKFKR